MRDGLDWRDSVAADYAKSALDRGTTPDMDRIHAYVAPMLERIDARAAEPVHGKQDDKPPVHKKTAAEILAEDGCELIVGPIKTPPPPRKPRTGAEKGEANAATRRLKLLGRYPEWQARMLEVFNEVGAIDFDPRFSPAERRAKRGDAWMRLLNESNRTFGEWDRPAPGPRIITVGKACR